MCNVKHSQETITLGVLHSWGLRGYREGMERAAGYGRPHKKGPFRKTRYGGPNCMLMAKDFKTYFAVCMGLSHTYWLR